MSDPLAMRDFAQALDGAEFDVISTAGHVLAVPPGRFPDRPTPTYAGPFHDPFVLFGYLAAITQRLHFRSGILILPLLPTALVAKQAAELQLLSGGRFELGVGISWNTLEYQALNQDFKARGKENGGADRRAAAAVERAIRHLRGSLAQARRRWAEPPAATPIPIWIGGGTDEVVLRRVARVADGWFPISDPTEALPKLQTVRARGWARPGVDRLHRSRDGRAGWTRRLGGVGEEAPGARGDASGAGYATRRAGRGSLEATAGSAAGAGRDSQPEARLGRLPDVLKRTDGASGRSQALGARKLSACLPGSAQRGRRGPALRIRPARCLLADAGTGIAGGPGSQQGQHLSAGRQRRQLAVVAHQRVHGNPAHARHGIVHELEQAR